MKKQNLVIIIPKHFVIKTFLKNNSFFNKILGYSNIVKI